ncbi:MAG: GatB/YqeY domain-containing protein [Candidatus Saccharibacteria bacterium]|nr:GatB/YqeY domain-containing protein [Candidatus Saccharibacteria bacterium]
MSLKRDIDADLKQALLSGDKRLVSVLRGVKSVILNEEVAQGKRESGLEDAVIIGLLQKEIKKRKEAAALYRQAGDSDRTDQEEYEAKVISGYVPEMMSEAEVADMVKTVISELGVEDMSGMGRVVGEAKKRSQGRADGAVIAKIAKEQLG